MKKFIVVCVFSLSLFLYGFSSSAIGTPVPTASFDETMRSIVKEIAVALDKETGGTIDLKKTKVMIGNFYFEGTQAGSSFAHFFQKSLRNDMSSHRYDPFDVLEETDENAFKSRSAALRGVSLMGKTRGCNTRGNIEQTSDVKIAPSLIIGGQFKELKNGDVRLTIPVAPYDAKKGLDKAADDAMVTITRVIPGSFMPNAEGFKIKPDHLKEHKKIVEAVTDMAPPTPTAWDKDEDLNVTILPDKGDGATYEDGELMHFVVRANKPCWLMVLHVNIDENKNISGQILFPNNFTRNNRLNPPLGGPAEVFIGKSEGFFAQKPFGTDIIKIFASEEPFPGLSQFDWNSLKGNPFIQFAEGKAITEKECRLILKGNRNLRGIGALGPNADFKMPDKRFLKRCATDKCEITTIPAY